MSGALSLVGVAVGCSNNGLIAEDICDRNALEASETAPPTQAETSTSRSSRSTRYRYLHVELIPAVPSDAEGDEFSLRGPLRLPEAEFVLSRIEEAVHHRAHISRLQHTQPGVRTILVRLSGEEVQILLAHEEGERSRDRVVRHSPVVIPNDGGRRAGRTQRRARRITEAHAEGFVALSVCVIDERDGNSLCYLAGSKREDGDGGGEITTGECPALIIDLVETPDCEGVRVNRLIINGRCAGSVARIERAKNLVSASGYLKDIFKGGGNGTI